MRLQTWLLINSNRQRKDQISKPEKLLKFEWEKQKPEKLTQDQKDYILDKWERKT